MKKILITGGVAALLIVSVAFKLKSNKHTVEENVYQPEPDKRVLVKGYTVRSEDFDKTYAYTGTFEAYREVLMIPQVHGQVEEVLFEEGDQVSIGQVLVQIDDDLLQAQFTAADASYQSAKKNLERYEGAAPGGGVSQIQLDNYTLALKNAESQVKQLSKQISLSQIRAPFAGTITLRDVEPGSLAGNQPVARVTDLTKLKLEISVPEKDIILFRESGLATIVTDIYPQAYLYGKIEYVSDRADQSHNYTVRLILKNSSEFPLKAGMYGTASLKQADETKSIIVPRTALLGSAKNPQVFVVENDQVTLRTIQTGKTTNESVEVLSGLKVGQVVVTSGHINLADGSKVDVIK